MAKSEPKLPQVLGVNVTLKKKKPLLPFVTSTALYWSTFLTIISSERDTLLGVRAIRRLLTSVYNERETDRQTCWWHVSVELVLNTLLHRWYCLIESNGNTHTYTRTHNTQTQTWTPCYIWCIAATSYHLSAALQSQCAHFIQFNNPTGGNCDADLYLMLPATKKCISVWGQIN